MGKHAFTPGQHPRSMPTYIYETIPTKPGLKTKRFEIKQSMHDAPLKKHPETGEAVQRVIAGGIGVITKHAPPPRPQGCCGGGGENCACNCGD